MCRVRLPLGTAPLTGFAKITRLNPLESESESLLSDFSIKSLVRSSIFPLHCRHVYHSVFNKAFEFSGLTKFQMWPPRITKVRRAEGYKVESHSPSLLSSISSIRFLFQLLLLFDNPNPASCMLLFIESIKSAY